MSCADVQTIQAGNGTKTQFSFDFPYIFKSEIRVYFWNATTKEWDEKLTTDATYPWQVTDANPTIVEFTGTAPPAPAVPSDPGEPTVDNVKIRRITNIDDIRALFNPGSAIRSDDLNKNFEQLRYAIQEAGCQQVPTEVYDFLKDYYWDNFDDTIFSTDTWVSNDTKIATTASIDDRVDSKVAAYVDGNFVLKSGGTLTGQLNLDNAGSASAPDLAFNGDANTGIYSPGADQVAISTGGAGRLFVSDDGKIGIGTATPSDYAIQADDLVIAPSTASAGISLVASTANYIYFSDLVAEGRGVISYSHGDDSFRFSTAASPRLVITSDGSVNIVGAGTVGVTQAVSFNGSAPVDSLVVNSSGNVSTAGTMTADSFIPASSTVPTNGVYLPSANNVAISTNGTGRLFISDDGRIGIGTATPSSYSILADNLVIAGASHEGISIISGTSSGGNIWFGDADGEGRGKIAYQHLTDSFSVDTAGSERLRIDGSGKLLVGTSSDSGGALLQVNGDRVRIATAKTPASASDTGTPGEICWDANYIYVCTAANTWKRTAIATW